MKKSINLYFAKTKAQKEKIQAIKVAGFDEFFCGVADATADLDLQGIVEYAQNVGLKCTMIHCAYDNSKVQYFWDDNVVGDEVCDDYCRQIEQCKGLTQDFVVHLNTEEVQKESEIGLSRIRKMLDVCEKCNINLCVENLCSAKEIPYIFANIKHKKLKICFDSGHQHFLMPDFDVLGKYHAYVTTLHLHDNHGLNDEHLPCGEGTVDWRKIAEGLKLIPEIVLTAEVKSGEEEINKNYLKRVYDGLCMVEKLLKNA